MWVQSTGMERLPTPARFDFPHCLCETNDCCPSSTLLDLTCAEVAELADAHGSGPCTRKGVGVRVPSSAPMISLKPRTAPGCSGAFCFLPDFFYDDELPVGTLK